MKAMEEGEFEKSFYWISVTWFQFENGIPTEKARTSPDLPSVCCVLNWQQCQYWVLGNSLRIYWLKHSIFKWARLELFSIVEKIVFSFSKFSWWTLRTVETFWVPGKLNNFDRLEERNWFEVKSFKARDLRVSRVLSTRENSSVTNFTTTTKNQLNTNFERIRRRPIRSVERKSPTETGDRLLETAC